MARKIGIICLALALIYLGIGLAFHIQWKSELNACRELRQAQGEFAEPKVFGGALGLVFDVTYWPVYARANLYHDGTPFATPCTHAQEASFSDEGEAR